MIELPWAIRKLFEPEMTVSNREAYLMRESILSLQKQLARKLPQSTNPVVQHKHALLRELQSDLVKARSTLEKIMTYKQ